MKWIRSLNGRLNIILLLAVMTPVIALSTIAVFITQTQVKQDILQHYVTVVSEEGNILQSVFDTEEITVLQFRDLPPVQGILRAQKTGTNTVGTSSLEQWTERLGSIFEQTIRKDPSISSARFINKDGQELVSVRRSGTNQIITSINEGLQDKSKRTYFIEGMNASYDEVYFSPIELNKEFGEIETPYRPVIRLVTPVINENTKTKEGVISVNIEINDLFRKLKGRLKSNNEELIVTDSEGYFLLHPDTTQLYGRELNVQKRLANQSPELAIAITRSAQNYFYNKEEKRYYIWSKLYFSPHDSSQFLNIIHSIPEAEILQAMQGLKFSIVIVAILTAIATSIVIFLTAKRITKPLSQLTSVTEDIAQGNTTEEIPAVNRKDEIGVLARALASMQTKLSEGNRELEERVEARTKELNELLKEEEKSRSAILNIMEDMEKLKEESKASKEQMEAMVANIPGTVYRCLCDKNWTMQYISENILTLSGYPSSDFIDNAVRTYASVIHPDDAQLVENKVLEGVQTNTPYEVEYRIVRRDGGIRWVFERGRASYAENNTIQILNGVILDITKRKEAESDAMKFKEAVDSSSDAIVITDTDTNIIFVNDAWQKLNGYTEQEALGQNPNILKSGKTPKHVYEDLYKALKKGDNFHSEEIVNKRKNGTEYIAELTLYPIKDRLGNIQNYVGIQKDITKRKHADVAKSEFVSLASHQLRTPLTALRWILQRLEQEKSGPLNMQQQELVGDAYQSCVHMNETINTMLMLSRYEAKDIALDTEEVGLCELITEAFKRMEITIEKKNLTIHKGCPNEAAITTDKRLLTEILNNLVSNAVKYTPSNGEVTVSAKTADDHAIITIQDTGLGIPAHQQPKIFTKFFRADNVVSKDTEGTGLGLYLVSSLVKLLGGTIEFTSEENKGTTFTIHLPLNPPSHE